MNLLRVLAAFLAAGFTLGVPAAVAASPAAAPTPPPAPTPDWIGPAATSTNAAAPGWFRTRFRTPPYTWNARLTVAAGGPAEVFLNGKPVIATDASGQTARAEVSMNLIQGENTLAVRTLPGAGGNGPTRLLVHLNLGGTETRQILSDTNWLVASRELPGWNQSGADTRDWSPARLVATYDASPWGPVLQRASATPAAAIQLLPGFTAELLRSAGPDEGSWICMTFDPQGRLYVSPEGDAKPVLRFRFGPDGQPSAPEPVPAPIRSAMGLLWAHGSLYANARGPSGAGLHRLTDTNGNDRLEADELRLLKEFKTGGEHGYHGLRLGPDGRIYVLNGNMVRVPEGLSPHSPHRHWGEDMLSASPDENARAAGAPAPGSHLLRTDPDGRSWEIVAGGMRNAYDFDFNPDGELFVFDSDNEWDWGTPWYRATRVYHAVSGAEMGWRDGIRTWPDHYPDMVGAVIDIGIGSPCGVRFGTQSRFPEPYRSALFLQDWSYGRILALHLQPAGATYRGTRFEEFAKGQPLNLTSMAFGPDGALYFVTGGRGTQSGLYRIRANPPADTHPSAPAPSTPLPVRDPAATAARTLRRQLEAYHGAPDPAAIPAAWPHLGHPDRAIRFAARIALEAQPTDAWLGRAIAETNAATALHALLALARVGPASTQTDLLRTLGRFPLASLDEDLRLLKYRIIGLSFLRQGRPQPALVDLAISKLSPRYPASTWAENRELSRLLLWLGAPDTIGRTLDLLERAPFQEHQIHYVSQLRHLREGWSDENRRRYLAWWLQPRDHLQRPGSLLHWFHDVGRTYVDGAAVDRHLQSFRRDAIAALPESRQAAFRDLTEPPMAGATLVPAQPRAFVRAWTLDELLPDLDRAAAGRDFERGRRAFIDTQCYACHRLGNTGSAVGPELGGLASKYGRREILESLVDPSRVISEQYQNLRVFLKDGDDVSGRLVRESPAEIVLETDPIQRTEQAIPRATVERTQPSTVSPMPEGLLHVLEKEEILDLVAFLESGGRSEAPAFKRPERAR